MNTYITSLDELVYRIITQSLCTLSLVLGYINDWIFDTHTHTHAGHYVRAQRVLATEELSKLGEIWPFVPFIVLALSVPSPHTRLIVLCVEVEA